MMKRILGWICCAALAVLATPVSGLDATKGGQPFTQKQDDAHYLAGAVPVVDGQVVFQEVLELPGMSQDEIYDKIKGWLDRSQQRDKDIILNRAVVREDKAKGEIYVQSEEYLVLIDRGLSLDRAQFSYLQSFICSPGKCVSEIRRLRYVYEDEVHTPEGWITDDYAMDKGKKKLFPGVKKMRVKTVDRMDDLFAGLTETFSVSQIVAPTPVAAAMASTQSVMFPAAAPASVPAMPLTPAMIVAPEATAVASLPATEGAALPGYKRIAPERIPGNIIKMLTDNWMLVTAGNETQFNMMTAGWGGLGVLFEKPVAFCFISPARYTWQLLDKGDTYTLSFYTEAYRDALQICGTTSGRDTDKVKAAGLTPVTTPSGAKAFAEAWMVIECRQMMEQPLTQSSITDPAERSGWDGKPLNTMFVGEILNVWIK